MPTSRMQWRYSLVQLIYGQHGYRGYYQHGCRKATPAATPEAKIAANGITGDLVIVADSLNAGNVAKLFAKYGGTSATVDLGNNNLAKLTEVTDWDQKKISAGGMQEHPIRPD